MRAEDHTNIAQYSITYLNSFNNVVMHLLYESVSDLKEKLIKICINSSQR